MPRSATRTVSKPTKLGDTEDARALLFKSSWLMRAGPAAALRLAPHCRFRAVAAGGAVVRRGAPVRHLTVLVRGGLEIGLSSADGRRMVIGQLTPGMAVGLAALLDARSSLQDARASVDSVVMFIPRAELLAAARDLPELAEALLRHLAGRVRTLLTAYADRSLMPLRPRLAALLLRLAKAAGASQQPAGATVALAMAQDDLAAMLGVTRQHLSPVLKQLERERLVDLGYRRITLPDPAGLARIVDPAGPAPW